MNPIYMNYFLMVVYVTNSTLWFMWGNHHQALYWLSAFGITVAVTWGIAK